MHRLQLALLFIAFLPVAPATAAPRSASIHSHPPDHDTPVIDGVLREPLWHLVPPLAQLKRSSKSYDLSHIGIWRGTTARVYWDDDTLYVAIVCRVLEADRLVVEGTGKDDDTILAGDWVGLSISRDEDPLPTHWFIVDPRNLRWDGVESEAGRDASPDPQWRSAVAFQDHRFTVEMAIPFDAIGGKPAPAEQRRVNVVRHCRARRHQLLAWSHQIGMEADPQEQGIWTFETSPPPNLPDPWHGDPLRGRNPAAIADVVLGRRADASAAWWGFDPKDATRFLQAAINSGAAKVIVPNMGQDWVIEPIVPASHQEIFFEPGVVVTAKKGAFRESHDALFRARNVTHLTMTGYGATLRMQKADYTLPPYGRSQWRHGLEIESCHNVLIQGLTIRETGGDGILLGSWGWGVNRDVVIRDCHFDLNHRQGISIICAENLLIENCIFSNTQGTGPSAGIDFEPDEKDERLVNCVVRNCIAENNDGTGFTISVTQLGEKARDVSILLENCLVRGGNRYGFNVSGPTRSGPDGSIIFRNCHVENVQKQGVRILDKTSDRLDLRFENCSWKNVGAADADTGQYRNVPILFHLRERRFAPNPGRVIFQDCVVIDDQDRPFIAYGTPVKDPPPLRGISGSLTVHNPHGARAELGSEEAGQGLRVSGQPQ